MNNLKLNYIEETGPASQDDLKKAKENGELKSTLDLLVSYIGSGDPKLIKHGQKELSKIIKRIDSLEGENSKLKEEKSQLKGQINVTKQTKQKILEILNRNDENTESNKKVLTKGKKINEGVEEFLIESKNVSLEKIYTDEILKGKKVSIGNNTYHLICDDKYFDLTMMDTKKYLSDIILFDGTFK